MQFLKGLIGQAWSWAKENWKTLASLAISAAVFSAVVFFMPVAVPAMLGYAIAGFVSGAVGAVVADLLDRKTPTIKHVLLAATISTVLAAGSFGVAKVVGPYLGRFWKPLTSWVVRPAVSVVGRPAVTAITNTVVTVVEPIIVNGFRAVELSAGTVGTEVARSVRKPDDAPKAGAESPRATPEPAEASEDDPPPTRAPPASAAGHRNGRPESAGMLGALSNASR